MPMTYPDNSYSDNSTKPVLLKTKYNYKHKRLARIISKTGLTVEFKKFSPREAIFSISSNGSKKQDAALKAFYNFFSKIGQHEPGKGPI